MLINHLNELSWEANIIQQLHNSVSVNCTVCHVKKCTHKPPMFVLNLLGRANTDNGIQVTDVTETIKNMFE